MSPGSKVYSLLLMQAAFERGKVVGCGTIERGHARSDCDNECGCNRKEKQQE